MTPAIEIQNLAYSYPDGTPALNGINLLINPGEKVAILGANGAGKSTLLLHLNGLLRGNGTGPRVSAVRIFGETVNGKSLAAIRQKVGFVFQNPDDQLFCPTVYDDVAFGPRNMKLDEAEVERRTKAALETVGLADIGGKNVFHLSVGQKKRAAIATVLSMDPELLVFDEPTSNLDPRGRRELLALLEKLPKTQIIATHNLEAAEQICSRAIILFQGRIVADGDTQRILGDKVFLQNHGL
jgi:cobalt/nickel transport system ATP-binding protein